MNHAGKSRDELFQQCQQLYHLGRFTESADLSFHVLGLAQGAGDQMMEMGVMSGLTACQRKLGKLQSSLQLSRQWLVVVRLSVYAVQWY